MNDVHGTYPPVLPDAAVEAYKQIDAVKMQLWIFTPHGHSASHNRPAILFFFGGGFLFGNPAQFAKHCAYLADRGMVAISADYRVLDRHGTRVATCVSDAKSALRYVRANAGRLGIDPDRIAAGGGSAGGYLAAALATLDGLDDPGDDPSISARPNALVLFNPGLVSADIPGKMTLDEKRHKLLAQRWGDTPLESVSPYHKVAAGTAPAIVFHGTGDTTIPYQASELFAEKMRTKGNRCELVGYEGAEHGFFNYGRDNNGGFVDSVHKMDDFLVSLGYLKGAPKAVHYK